MTTPLRTLSVPSPALILIGMATAGKSTIGRRLADSLRWPFVDTDVVLAQDTGRDLPSLLATHGAQRFCQLEAQSVCHLVAGQQVIATGGSLIYSPKALQYLKHLGYLIWLDVPTEQLLTRLADSPPRGLVRLPSDPLPLKALIQKRRPMYQQAADLVLPVGTQTEDNVLSTLHALIQTHRWEGPTPAQPQAIP